jgi:hypothetical protein
VHVKAQRKAKLAHTALNEKRRFPQVVNTRNLDSFHLFSTSVYRFPGNPSDSGTARETWISGLQKLEARRFIRLPRRRRIRQFDENDLQNVPYPDTRSHASRNRRIFSPECAVHVENRFSRVVGEKGSHGGRFVDVLQDMLQGNNRFHPPFRRPDNQGAPTVGPAHGQKRRGPDALRPGKLFDFFMKNVTVFQADHKNPSLFRL